MRKPTRSQLIYVLFAALAALGLIAVFLLGKHCGSTTVIEEPSIVVDTTKVDVKVEQQTKQAAQEAAHEIEVLEQTHAEVIDEFDDKQRQEYEQVKQQGPKRVAAWLSDFNRDLKGEP